jgi:hypothetical protein
MQELPSSLVWSLLLPLLLLLTAPCASSSSAAPAATAAVAVAATASSSSPPGAAFDLRVEYAPCPVAGVGVKRPRFSWALSHPDRAAFQSAYHVLVALEQQQSTAVSVSGSEDGGGVVWDSGVVTSNNTIGIACGVDLDSDTAYTLSVVWLDHNSVAAPTATGSFSTALLDPANEWAAAGWLVVPEPNSSSDSAAASSSSSAPGVVAPAAAPRNQFRATLTVPNERGAISRATCFVCGLGCVLAR